MKRLSLILCASCALFLPSCGPWYIGDRIRYDSEVHVGAAIKHATVHYYDAESLAWMKEDPRHRSIGDPSYVLAPEVTYRIRRPIVYGIWTMGEGAGYTLTDITPTGRMVLVRPRGRFRTDIWDNELLENLPEGMAADPQRVPADKPYDYVFARDLGDFDSPPATRGSLGAQMAAAPFDYVIDPALSAVTLSPLLVPAVVIGGTVVVVATPIWLTRRLFGDRQALPPWKYHYLLP